MKTSIIVVKKDIVIPKGTFVPMLTYFDEVMPFDHHIKKDTILRGRSDSWVSYIKNSNGTISPKTYAHEQALFFLVCNKAILYGAESKTGYDKMEIFGVFESGNPDDKVVNPWPFNNYIRAESIEHASVIARDIYKKIQLPRNFKYHIFKW